MCGQEWAKGRSLVGGKCPGPTIWGQPQQNRPWLVPEGNNMEWGTRTIINAGPEGHKLQWYQGVLYCALCGGWTVSGGRPRKLIETCKGRSPVGKRMLKAVANNQPPSSMKCQ
eukprot:10741334-Karenia_brevis.AAC.1